MSGTSHILQVNGNDVAVAEPRSHHRQSNPYTNMDTLPEFSTKSARPRLTSLTMRRFGDVRNRLVKLICVFKTVVDNPIDNIGNRSLRRLLCVRATKP